MIESLLYLKKVSRQKINVTIHSLNSIKIYTTRKLSNCGGCKNRRYMSPIAALFWPVAVHEIYCGIPYARRNSSSILRRATAAG